MPNVSVTYVIHTSSMVSYLKKNAVVHMAQLLHDTYTLSTCVNVKQSSNVSVHVFILEHMSS